MVAHGVQISENAAAEGWRKDASHLNGIYLHQSLPEVGGFPPIESESAAQGDLLQPRSSLLRPGCVTDGSSLKNPRTRIKGNGRQSTRKFLLQQAQMQKRHGSDLSDVSFQNDRRFSSL